jgi:hypothetical protein
LSAIEIHAIISHTITNPSSWQDQLLSVSAALVGVSNYARLGTSTPFRVCGTLSNKGTLSLTSEIFMVVWATSLLAATHVAI